MGVSVSRGSLGQFPSFLASVFPSEMGLLPCALAWFSGCTQEGQGKRLAKDPAYRSDQSSLARGHPSSTPRPARLRPAGAPLRGAVGVTRCHLAVPLGFSSASWRAAPWREAGCECDLSVDQLES